MLIKSKKFRNRNKRRRGENISILMIDGWESMSNEKRLVL